MKLKEIVGVLGAKAANLKHDFEIRSVSTDSRTIKKGELFIALNGTCFSGRDFIDNAIKKGACAVISDKQVFPVPNKKVPFLFVRNTKNALSLIAQYHRKLSLIPFICIVGSNGKTTTKELLSHILESRFLVLKTRDNENNQVGIAKTILRLKGHDIAVIEAGTNSPGEIAYSSKIIKPDIAVTLNIGLSHLAGLKTSQGVFREKIAIVKSLPVNGSWIRNSDDKALANYNRKGVQVIDFGVKNKAALYRATNISCTDKGTRFIVNGKDFFVPLLGMHNVYNSLAAISVASIFMEDTLIASALALFKPAPMRMQALRFNRMTIINDAYNANPDSLKSAVSALKDIQTPGRNILVCADMLELGGKAIELHYNCGRFIAKSKTVDMLFGLGKYAPHILKGALDSGMKKNNVKEFQTKKQIVDFIKAKALKNDTILVKGSRSMKMDEVVEELLRT